jgi:hypothetical protein
MKAPERPLTIVGGADPDPQLDGLFAAARELAEPSLESRARVTLALRAALPAASPSGFAERGVWPDSSERSLEVLRVQDERPYASKRATTGSVKRWLVGGALIGGLGLWGGYRLGHSAGYRDALVEAKGMLQPGGSAVASSHVPERGTGPGRDEFVTDEPGLQEPAMAKPAVEWPVIVDESTSAAAAATDKSPDVGASESTSVLSRVPARVTRRAGERRAGVTPPRAPEAAGAGMNFRQVLEQLRRARELLDRGQATLSLLLLSELERDAGQLLLEEREATRVLALCAAGQPRAAQAAAQRLEQNSPRSIYLTRLSSSCVNASVSEH